MSRRSLSETLAHEARRESASVPASDTLFTHPEAVLDMQTELDGYFDRMSKLRPDQFDTVWKRFTKINRNSAPNTNPRAVVVIPVAIHQENGSLFKTLEQFEEQTARDDFEIMLYLNHPAGRPIYKDVIDNLHTYQADSQLVINIAGTTYEDLPQMSTVRKDACDLTAFDIWNRFAENDVIIINNDADAVDIAPNYVQAMIDAAHSMPKADIFSGQLYWERNINTPTLNQLFGYWEALVRRGEVEYGQVSISDANTAIRLSTYAASGGFIGGEEIGEMHDLTKKVSKLRKKDTVVKVSDAELTTSSRRLVKCMALGVPMTRAWVNVRFTAVDKLRVEQPMWFEAERKAFEKLNRHIDDIETAFILYPQFEGVLEADQIDEYLRITDATRSALGFHKLNKAETKTKLFGA